MKIRVLQSQRQPLPAPWFDRCLDSVQRWAQVAGYEYEFIDDQLFAPLAADLRQKFGQRPVVLADLARLLALREALNQGCDRVLWLDADVLVFRPQQLQLPPVAELPEGYMLGREIWVQPRADKPHKLQAYKKVHNAFLLFDRGNSFLDFYIDQAERLLRRAQPSIPAQFVGPKLLTALHNVIQCPVLETVGMLSPEVVLDLLSGGERRCALNLLRKRSPEPMAAANLCGSSVSEGALGDADMAALCKLLLQGNVNL